jgi:hypothetical protein
MSAFADTVMLRLNDPANLQELVAPAADATHQRVRELFAATYALPFATLHDVLRVEVLASEFQRPLFPPRRLAGTWTQTIPSHARTDILYEGQDGLTPEWLDVTARVGITVVLEVDAGEVESIQIRDLGSFSTLAEFQAKFRYFDLDAFMAEHDITTVGELRRAYRYLLGRVKLKDLPPFDPASPANQRRFELNLAVLIRDRIDLGACLRDVRLVREAAERSLAYRRDAGEAEVLAPYAPVLVLPESELAATGFTEAALAGFFAGQDVLAVFLTP